jgi:Rrf2 family protein
MYNAVMIVLPNHPSISCDLHTGLIHWVYAGLAAIPATDCGLSWSVSSFKVFPRQSSTVPGGTCGIHAATIGSPLTKTVRFALRSREGTGRLIITSKSDYGLRAVLYLAGRHDRVRLREISESQHIPESVCAQIMRKLVGAQIVASQAGPAGGYTLARAPESISVGSVLAASDRDICIFRCTEEGCDCDLNGKCAFQLVLKGFAESIATSLEQLSLAELRRRQDALPEFKLPAIGKAS